MRTIRFVKTAMMAGVFAIAAASCCDNKEYNDAVGYLDELQNEVNHCSTQAEWNAVQMKIVAINQDPRFVKVDGKYSAEQAKSLKTRMVALTYTAIAKQTVLWEDLQPLRMIEARLPEILKEGE